MFYLPRVPTHMVCDTWHLCGGHIACRVILKITISINNAV